jgi:hypothetical protein
MISDKKIHREKYTKERNKYRGSHTHQGERKVSRERKKEIVGGKTMAEIYEYMETLHT